MGFSIMDEMQQGGSFQNERRILVYLLLDVSGSMCGAALTAVQEGVEFLGRELRKTPEAVELAHLGVITFGSQASLVTALTPLMEFQAPKLVCGGGTNMTDALVLVDEQITKDFRPNLGGEVRGDYKPLLFLLTDGAPNNLKSAVSAAQKLKNRPSGATIGTFLALGCGPHANRDNLEQIAPTVGMMADMSAENLRQFFVWLTASVQIAARRASQASADVVEGDSFRTEGAPVPRDSQGELLFEL
jgi:uncharacterized protein YegL